MVAVKLKQGGDGAPAGVREGVGTHGHGTLPTLPPLHAINLRGRLGAAHRLRVVLGGGGALGN